jgi:hypothetical protein
VNFALKSARNSFIDPFFSYRIIKSGKQHPAVNGLSLLPDTSSQPRYYAPNLRNGFIANRPDHRLGQENG